jgi:hypothetical protein
VHRVQPLGDHIEEKKWMVETLRGEVLKILWTVRSHRSVRRLRVNVFSTFRHFGVRHFRNPDDKELGHFALKTPKSRNVTCPWSRDVVPEEATILEFNISAFQGPGDRRTKNRLQPESRNCEF